MRSVAVLAAWLTGAGGALLAVWGGDMLAEFGADVLLVVD